MELQLLELNQPLNTHILNILVKANPYLASDEALLLSYYKRVRATWSSSAIKALQKETGLKLTSKLNRCRFALAAAKKQLQLVTPEKLESNDYLTPIVSSPSTTPDEIIVQLETQLKEQQEKLKQQQEELEQQQEQRAKTQTFAILLLTHRLLPPGLPLNGTEDSPAMRILGSPKTLTELNANYRELIKREHPDVSLFSEEEAIHRFAYIRSLYRITREHWQQLKPTAVITTKELEKRMKAPVPFAVESFWAA